MKKVILNLQWVISVFKIQDNQRITLNDMCWVFDQKTWFLKDLFQNWYLSDLISSRKIVFFLAPILLACIIISSLIHKATTLMERLFKFWERHLSVQIAYLIEKGF